MPSRSAALREQFGDIDIYLFDQVLKGRFDATRRILDVGCGGGRNLMYFLRSGVEVFAVDRDRRAVEVVRTLATTYAPGLPADNFKVAEADKLPWPDASMDVVISSAVLHFADDTAHFGRMLREMWRVLQPGGFFFARLASSIGIADRIQVSDTGRARLPDGSDRFVVDEEMLIQWTEQLGAALAEPIKTTNVQDLRAMTTWCLSKRLPEAAMRRR